MTWKLSFGILRFIGRKGSSLLMMKIKKLNMVKVRFKPDGLTKIRHQWSYPLHTKTRGPIGGTLTGFMPLF
jgi:hypothetical protein